MQRTFAELFNDMYGKVLCVLCWLNVPINNLSAKQMNIIFYGRCKIVRSAFKNVYYKPIPSFLSFYILYFVTRVHWYSSPHNREEYYIRIKKFTCVIFALQLSRSTLLLILPFPDKLIYFYKSFSFEKLSDWVAGFQLVPTWVGCCFDR